MEAAIKTTKERGFYRAVAVDRFREYSDADVAVTAPTRSEAIKAARAQLKAKGYRVVPQWQQ